MEFQGPSATDYENVHSLNRAFLTMLRRNPAARRCLEGLPQSLSARLVGLSETQAEWLSTTPFLLMSFREKDDIFWQSAFAPSRSRDLFAVPQTATDDLGRLIAAGLGFIWQLAKQSPYAARLICGASLNWCEQLTERTFFRLLTEAGDRNEVLVLRCATDTELWTKLVQSGVSRESQVRRAAHISALQSVLTGASMPGGRKWAAAACAVRNPSLRVADETESR